MKRPEHIKLMVDAIQPDTTYRLIAAALGIQDAAEADNSDGNWTIPDAALKELSDVLYEIRYTTPK